MIESTVRAERSEAPSSASLYYTWEVGGKPVSVRFPYDLIDRLERETLENFRSPTSRGAEIGGVLFGSATAGNPSIISIEEFELVACDYSRGPLYRLADADLERFDRILTRPNANSVGFFRSHTRKALALDTDDLAVMESRFRDPKQIALLVRPYATKASAAGVFIWEAGAIHAEGSYLEFPFRSSQLVSRTGPQAEPGVPAATTKPRAQIVPIASRRETPVMEPSPAPEAPAPAPVEPATPAANGVETKAAPAEPLAPKTPVPEPTAAVAQPPVVEPPVAKPPASLPDLPTLASLAPKSAVKETETLEAISDALSVPEAVEPSKRSGKFAWILAGIAAVLLVAVGLFVYPGVLRRPVRPAVTPAQDPTALSLRVERTAGELLLTWNRDSEAVRNATHAVLSISDGEQNENVQLDLNQLHNGSIVYAPVSPDVTFKMEIQGQNGAKPVSESVRVLRTRPSPMDGTNSAATPTPAAGAPGAPAATAAGAPGNPASNPANNDEAAEEPPAKLERAVKPFRAESLGQRLHPASQSDLPDAPALGGIQGSAASPSPLNLNSISAPSVPAPPPAAPKAAAPEPKREAGGQIVQAQLLRRKEPEYPKIARDAGAKGKVELLATIGADGKIKSVKAIHGHPMLIKAATEAVMQWQYRPTMLNGTAIESQTQIVLNFLGDR